MILSSRATAFRQLRREENKAHSALQSLLQLRQPDFYEQARDYASFYMLQDDLLEDIREEFRKAGL